MSSIKLVHKINIVSKSRVDSVFIIIIVGSLQCVEYEN